MSTSICIYFPGNPEALFRFLDSVPPSVRSYEFLLFVDNDDHKTSSEFYTLRRYIRKGLKLQVFIEPALNDPDQVFSYLKEKSTGDLVLENNSYRTSLADMVQGIATFEEGQDVVQHEKA